MLLVLVMIGVVSLLHYKEDIADFLPIDGDYREAMRIYQDVSAGDRIVLRFSAEGLIDAAAASDSSTEGPVDMSTVADLIVEAIAAFGDTLAIMDTASWLPDFGQKADMDGFLEVMDLMYARLPYLLTEADYAALDSAWHAAALGEEADAHFFSARLAETRRLLDAPTGSVMFDWVPYDPLGLFAPIGARMKAFQPDQMTYRLYGGELFSPDMRHAFVSIRSPFGSSETDGNGRLLALLDDVTRRVQAQEAFRAIEIRPIGAPVIAVTNAQQIRRDSISAMIIAVVLILLLLAYALRSLRAMLLIACSTLFGFIFALACIGLFRAEISLIVLGIAAAIIGIAVNYPLHYVCHLRHQPDPKQTLRDLASPLLIGNITTVGAFLTLVPLEAVAVSDLGIFSAMMLVGTVGFVMIFLPHLSRRVYVRAIDEEAPPVVQGRSRLSAMIYSPWFALVFLALTGVFGWLSLRTTFDTNLNHINYMTEAQREDLARLSALRGEAQGATIYLAAQGKDYDEAAARVEPLSQVVEQLRGRGLILSERNPVLLLPSRAEQVRRHQLWIDFWQRHDLSALNRAAADAGFAEGAFDPFLASTVAPFELQSFAETRALVERVLQNAVNDHQIVAQLVVRPEDVAEVEAALAKASEATLARQSAESDAPVSSPSAVHIFDLTSLNGRIAGTLSADFNYIGLACGCIVFVFLWLSFRRFEIALVAFVPMAIGWIWILGLMQLFGIQFNIVNIILATFIFGQGDDYTIFITEGLIRDYRSGGRVLVSYRRSILLSALIMLIGIGALIVARHPALHSLAEVTIIGMVVVVAMAWLVPPIVFHWLLRLDRPLKAWLDRQDL